MYEIKSYIKIWHKMLKCQGFQITIEEKIILRK